MGKNTVNLATPKSLNHVLAELMIRWKETNPEAIRKFYEWNMKNDNALLEPKKFKKLHKEHSLKNFKTSSGETLDLLRIKAEASGKKRDYE